MKGKHSIIIILSVKIDHEMPTGMQGFAFNIRRDIFINPMVRQALTYAFDFEWTNKTFSTDNIKEVKAILLIQN